MCQTLLQALGLEQRPEQTRPLTSQSSTFQPRISDVRAAGKSVPGESCPRGLWVTPQIRRLCRGPVGTRPHQLNSYLNSTSFTGFPPFTVSLSLLLGISSQTTYTSPCSLRDPATTSLTSALQGKRFCSHPRVADEAETCRGKVICSRPHRQ